MSFHGFRSTDEKSVVTPAPPARSPQVLRGALFMLASCAFIAGTTLLAKALGNGASGPALHPLQVSAGRFVFAFVALCVAAPNLKLTFSGTKYPLHLVRSLFGWVGVSCMFAAAARMPLADATAISFLNPIFTMILAIPLLGERVGPVRWSAAAISIVGALILIQPGTDAFQIVALIALAAALFMGVEVTCIKRLTVTEPAIRILFINNAIGACLAGTAAVFVWLPPTPMQWVLLAALGLVMVLAQTFFIQSMKSADASFAVPFLYSTLVFAGLYDFVLFDVIPTGISLLGASIIILGVVFLALRERHLARRRAEQG